CNFFFQAEDGIRGFHVTGVQSVLFRSIEAAAPEAVGAASRAARERGVADVAAGIGVEAQVLDRALRAHRERVQGDAGLQAAGVRSEERRVGKERRAAGSPKKQNTRSEK